VESAADNSMASAQSQSSCEADHWRRQPVEVASSDPDVLRAALIREAAERRRAECRVKIQSEVVQLALDLLVREPDVEGFFGALTKTMVEEGELHACGVWLIDDERQRCDLWMAYIRDRLYTPQREGWDTLELPRESMATHVFGYTPGWNQTVEYQSNDPRLPESVRAFNREAGANSLVITPLVLGSRNLGWVAITTFLPKA